MFRLCLLFMLFIPLLSYSQYRTVDSTARTVKYHGDIYKLTADLTGQYDQQILKVRAIFIWITDNIAYDYKSVNKGKAMKGWTCKGGENCELVERNWEYNYIRKILKEKKAVCAGYARLFKRMCNISGVKCEIVSGYTKTKFYQIGNLGSVNHDWNAVWLDSGYYFMDATWASGGCDETESGRLLSFEKQFKDYYWCTPFHNLARNHYPKDAKWVFEDNYTKEKYADNAYYAPGIVQKINIISPSSGVIKAKKGDTLHFKFDYEQQIQKLQVNSNVFRNLPMYKTEKISRRKEREVIDTFAASRQKYIPFTQQNNRYEFDYIITDNSLYYLDILFDYQRSLRFKVKIEEI